MTGSALVDAALNSLENVDDDRVVTIAVAIWCLRSSRQKSSSDRAELIK
jgi:hypothetical protein